MGPIMPGLQGGVSEDRVVNADDLPRVLHVAGRLFGRQRREVVSERHPLANRL